jgi:hypothetical protein
MHLVEERVFTQIGEEDDQVDASKWVVDTGATNHMTDVREAFSDLDTGVRGTVRFGDGLVVHIEGCGTIIFSTKSIEHCAFIGIYFIPKLKTNILSVGQLDEIGYEILIKSSIMCIKDAEDQMLARIPHAVNWLYVLNATIAHLVCLLTWGQELVWRWHARLGHLGFKGLKKMVTGGWVHGLPQIEHVDQLCDECLVGKHQRTPFPEQEEFRSKRVLEMVHGDLYGPIKPATPSGMKLFVLLVDDFSGFMWVAMIYSKDEALDAIKRV